MRSLQDKRYRTIISRLKKARLAKGLKQTDVAKQMNRPQSFLSKVEKLERRLDAIETYDLMQIYGIGWDELVGKL